MAEEIIKVELYPNPCPGINSSKPQLHLGNCEECGREQRLYGCHKRKLCGTCKGNYYISQKIKAAVIEERHPNLSDLPPKEPPIYQTILLDFHERDTELWEFLQSEAYRLRRNIDQQTMWCLQSIYDASKEIKHDKPEV